MTPSCLNQSFIQNLRDGTVAVPQVYMKCKPMLVVCEANSLLWAAALIDECAVSGMGVSETAVIPVSEHTMQGNSQPRIGTTSHSLHCWSYCHRLPGYFHLRRRKLLSSHYYQR